MQRQRRLLVPALLAGFGLASFRTALAQPQPYADDPPQYRSNKPYGSENVTEESIEREAAAKRKREAQQARDSDTDQGPGQPPRTAVRALPRAEGGTEFKGVAQAGTPWTLTGGADIVDNYFYRGYQRENGGLAFQPYATFSYTVFRDENLAITPHVGGWLNYTGGPAPSSPKHFQEVDLLTGVRFDVGDFAIDLQYIYYTFPNQFMRDVHEIGGSVKYDDSRLWAKNDLISGLNPSVALFYQTRDDNDNDYNTYVGVGLEPALREFKIGPVPVDVTVPMTFGATYDGYYKDDDGHNSNAGFWMVGVKAGVPLPRTGYNIRWSLEAEVDYLSLLADSVENANGGDSNDVVLRVGIKFR
jgi:hypothetical protein